MKKILIVTGSDYTKHVYQAFSDVKKLGHKLYLLSDGSFEPQEGIFEEHYKYDLRKTKKVLDYMKKQPVKFDAVTIKTSEWLTPLVALLAKQYGCIGNEPIVAFNCRSKYHMRKKMEEGGVPIPKFKLCRDYNELVAGIKEIGVPCIAKPVGGNASYGTFSIREEKDLDGLKEKYDYSIEYLKKKAISEDVFAFNDEEMDLIGVEEKVHMVTDYLIEEFMAGPEISIDALVQNGEVTIMGIEDQIRMQPPYFLEIAARLPYLCTKEKEHEIYDLVCKTIKALGIYNSATHTEIIFCKDGPKIVEIGCRIGGDDLHDTILQVTGYNLMYESIMIALGIKRNYNVQTKCHTMMQFLFADKAGELKDIIIPENLKKDYNIFSLDILIKNGTRVDVLPKSFDYLGYVGVYGETPEKAEENLKNAISKIKILIE